MSILNRKYCKEHNEEKCFVYITQCSNVMCCTFSIMNDGSCGRHKTTKDVVNLFWNEGTFNS